MQGRLARKKSRLSNGKVERRKGIGELVRRVALELQMDEWSGLEK